MALVTSLNLQIKRLDVQSEYHLKQQKSMLTNGILKLDCFLSLTARREVLV